MKPAMTGWVDGNWLQLGSKGVSLAKDARREVVPADDMAAEGKRWGRKGRIDGG